MDLVEDGIIIKYQTRRDYCSCCDREIKDTKISEVKKFKLLIKVMLEDLKWENYIEYEEDLLEIVDGYVHDVIGFHAVRSDYSLIIGKDESEKVFQFILNRFKK